MEVVSLIDYVVTVKEERMSVAANTALVERYIAEVWNGGKRAELDEFLAPDYYDYSFSPPDRAGLENILAITDAAFPGHQTIIESIVGQGDTVAVCETFRGVQRGPFRALPASGKGFEVARYRFFTVADGKITSHRGLLDLPALLRQLGAGE
jgi:steroid delta-isomerase-like uncharacterized protein